MDSFLKIYLPLFLICFLILVFVVPSVRIYKQTGINPFRFTTNHDQLPDYTGAVMKALILLVLFTVFVYVVSPTLYSYLVPFTYMEKGGLKIAGLLLGHLSLIGIMTAQYQMKQSWRIGIDHEHKTPLVTTGLFSISRNPVFLFLLLAIIGWFMIIPNALTFAILFAAYLVLQVTIRLEEAFLFQQHGTAYANYKQKVRRLL